MEVSDVIVMLFPDEQERAVLLQHALRKLTGEVQPKKLNVKYAGLVIQMQRMKRKRELLKLAMALQPDDSRGIDEILGDDREGTPALVAYLFGVTEDTVTNQWIPAGMPGLSNN